MRALIGAFVLALAGCGPGQAHVYPAEVRAAFDAQCQMGAESCACMWDKITRAMPHEEYAAAMTRFEAEGLMEPRITRARTECLAEGR